MQYLMKSYIYRIILLFVGAIIFFTPNASHAQLFELEVEQTEPEGPIPVFRNFVGKAGLIVQSSQTNLQFESNLEILDEQSNPDEGTYRIIVEPVNQYIRVTAPGFMTSRIRLNALQPNDVLYYAIEPVTFAGGGEASSEQTFQDIKDTGVQFYNDEDFYFALDRFNDALRLRPDNVEVTRYKMNTEDEIAWAEAKLFDTIESYNNYLNGETLKRYSAEAKDAIRNKRISLGEMYLSNRDYELAEQTLQEYLTNSPSGPESGKAKELLCRAYTEQGDNFSTQESLNGQGSALSFYQNALTVCPAPSDIENKLTATEKLYEKYSNPKWNYTMASFTFDDRNAFGITFGAINHFTRSGYVTFRLNTKLFTDTEDYTVNLEGVTDPPRSSGARNFSGEERKGNAEIVIGVTYPVYFPVWVYGGLGYAYNPTYWRMENINSTGDLIDTEWSRNTDSSERGIIFEIGAMANVVGLNFSLGLKGYSVSELTPTLSIGFLSKN